MPSNVTTPNPIGTNQTEMTGLNPNYGQGPPPTDTMRKRFKFNAEPPPPLRAKPFPWKSAALAIFLFCVGTFFCLWGTSVFWTVSASEAGPMITLGVFTFIPGSYHTWILFQSWRGVPGYSYDQIPDLYEEREADRM